MTADLHIPAYPALLDGWRGPVLREGMPGVLVGWHPRSACDADLWHVAAEGWDGWADGRPEIVICRTPELRLDLARDEVADRACRVLAAHYGLWTGGGVTWRNRQLRCMAAPGMYAGGPEMHQMERRFVDRMTSGERQLAKRRGMGRLWVVVPALTELDHGDNTRLASGARLVDRLALAAVVRHVLGGGA